MTDFASLVLFTSDLDRAAAFYRALGIALEDEDHGEGPRHVAAELTGVHVALHAAAHEGVAPPRRTAGSCFPGFYVDDLDGARAALEQLGSVITSGHEQMPWGCRFIAQDPDGRDIEVNDRAHCARD